MDGRIKSRWTAFSRTCRFPATLISSIFINSGGPERCRPPENAAVGRHFPGPADFQQRENVRFPSRANFFGSKFFEKVRGAPHELEVRFFFIIKTKGCRRFEIERSEYTVAVLEMTTCANEKPLRKVVILIM